LGSSFFAISSGLGAEPKEKEADGVNIAGGAARVAVEGGGAPNEKPPDLGGSCFFSSVDDEGVAPKENEDDDVKGAGGGGAEEVETKENEGFEGSSFFSVEGAVPNESEGAEGFGASTFLSLVVVGAEPKLNEEVGFAASTGFETVVEGAAPNENPPEGFVGSATGAFAVSTV